MADHSVVARDELHESEASWASVFCFDNASPEVFLRQRSGLFYFAMPTSFCVPEYVLDFFFLLVSATSSSTGTMWICGSEKCWSNLLHEFCSPTVVHATRT